MFLLARHGCCCGGAGGSSSLGGEERMKNGRLRLSEMGMERLVLRRSRDSVGGFGDGGDWKQWR